MSASEEGGAYHGRALELLADLAGPGSALRPDQLLAIDELVEHRRRVLLVQRTGWGKSAVYWIATRLLRDRGAGPTLVVSPLLALMRDQVVAAQRMGIRAHTINSTNAEEWATIEAALSAGDVDVLLISPERLNSTDFRAKALGGLSARIGMLVVDEAHCISDWGHDFRPDYRRLREVIARLDPDTPVLATTATANSRVSADIAAQIGTSTVVLRGELGRDSLHLSVVDLPRPAERLAYLARKVAATEGSGIVYCLTVAETETVALFLAAEGVNVASYNGGTEAGERLRIEADLKENRLKAVVATSALGMGFDKADLAFVIHLGSPSSPIAYYQQIGRAGRAIEAADVVLLPSEADRRIWAFFEGVAFPSEEATAAVLDHIADHGPVSVPGLEGAANLSRSRIEAMLKVLDVEGVVARSAGGWVRTEVEWTYDRERVARVRALRSREAEAMVAYAAGDDCRMRFLRNALDDPTSLACGRCDNCARSAGASDPTASDPTASDPTASDPTASHSAVERALAHLRSAETVVEARKAWPNGIGLRRGRIAPTLQAEAGRALAFGNDPGWYDLVSATLDQAGRGDIGAQADGHQPHPQLDPALDLEIDPELIGGCGEALRRWRWAARPTWVTWIPSRRRPRLGRSVAIELGRIGGLEVVETLTRIVDRPAQSTMANSSRAASNVLGAFEVTGAEAWPAGPVLVIDDTWRSGWTSTVTTELLRTGGAGPVLPFVLWKLP